MTIKVTCEVKVYELNDHESKPLDPLVVKVQSHWNYDDFVVLQVNDVRYTVSGRDLIRAVKNAMATKEGLV